MASNASETSATSGQPQIYVSEPDETAVQPIKLVVPRVISNPPITQVEKMLAGELYQCMDPDLLNGRMFARVIYNKFNASSPQEIKLRSQLTAELLGTKGPEVYIETPFHCDYGSNIHLGAGVYINFNCVILDTATVTVGPRCMFGPNVSIYTATHPIEPHARSVSEYGLPVTIGADCWIGGGVTILAGLTIGDCCVIGAGSVVTKSVPPYTVVAGNPAKKIKDVPRVTLDGPPTPSK